MRHTSHTTKATKNKSKKLKKKKRLFHILMFILLLIGMLPTRVLLGDVAHANSLNFQIVDGEVIVDNSIILSLYNFPVPEASGINTVSNEYAIIDYSNANDGYVMIKYLSEETEKELRVRVECPNNNFYFHILNADLEFHSFPLTSGNGKYEVIVFRQVEGTTFESVLKVEFDKYMENEFIPFLMPSSNVHFEYGCNVHLLASALTFGLEDTYDKVYAIYRWVISNITYDLDYKQGGNTCPLKTIITGRGACLDFATLTVSLLRSVGIPSKVVGGTFNETLYHAWVLVYLDDSWQLIDPTFSSEFAHRIFNFNGTIIMNRNVELYYLMDIR